MTKPQYKPTVTVCLKCLSRHFISGFKLLCGDQLSQAKPCLGSTHLYFVDHKWDAGHLQNILKTAERVAFETVV